MNVLIACEESQRVCIEFRKLGADAFSCDILPESGGHPEWHIQQDVLPLLNGNCKFITNDGTRHTINAKWDIIIAFPPCTYLTTAGAVRLYDREHNIKDDERFKKGVSAATLFNIILNSNCDKICVENPVPMKIFNLPKYNQIIQPYFFGEPYQKRTCLWLKNIPALIPTNIVRPVGYWIGAHGHGKAKHGMSKGFRDPKIRNKTFLGVAEAMANQWYKYIKENEQC